MLVGFHKGLSSGETPEVYTPRRPLNTLLLNVACILTGVLIRHLR